MQDPVLDMLNETFNDVLDVLDLSSDEFDRLHKDEIEIPDFYRILNEHPENKGL